MTKTVLSGKKKKYQEKSIISKDIRLVNTGIRIIPVNVVIFVHCHEYEISAT